MPMPFPQPWTPSQPAQALNVSVGNVSAEAAILQRIPPQSLPLVLENANKLANKQLDLQDRQLARAAQATEKRRDRSHELLKGREERAERRWNKLFVLVIVLSLAVVVAAWVLYSDGHWQAATTLISAMLSFGAGFVAGKGYEHARENEAEEKEDP
jgi:hypothetical protein